MYFGIYIRSKRKVSESMSKQCTDFILTLLCWPLRVLLVTGVFPRLLTGLSTTGMGSGSTSGSGSGTNTGAGATVSYEQAREHFDIFISIITRLNKGICLSVTFLLVAVLVWVCVAILAAVCLWCFRRRGHSLRRTLIQQLLKPLLVDLPSGRWCEDIVLGLCQSSKVLQSMTNIMAEIVFQLKAESPIRNKQWERLLLHLKYVPTSI